MKKAASFEYPAPFIGTDEDEGGVLSVNGARWFASILNTISGLEVDSDLCQEDWGVVIFVKRNKNPFDVFLWGGMSETANLWIVELRYGGIFGFQRFWPDARLEFARVLHDLTEALNHDSSVSNIQWFEKSADAFAALE
jgi:hypothetical protein